MGIPYQVGRARTRNGIGRRFLKHNRGTAHPSNLVFSGIAWHDIPHPKKEDRHAQVFAHAACRAQRIEPRRVSKVVDGSFGSSIELWEWIFTRLRKRTPLWIFVHDLPQWFTLARGWELLRRGVFGFRADEVRFRQGREPEKRSEGWRGLFLDGDPPVQLQLWHESGQKLFLTDIRNYFNESLQDLAERADMRWSEDPRADPGDEPGDAVAKYHAAIVHETMLRLLQWHKRGDYGNWSPTTSGIAWRAYRHKFMKWPIELHESEDVKLRERAAFHGGRVELFKWGKHKGGWLQLDVNQLYPYVMKTFDMPSAMHRCSEDARGYKLRPDQLTASYIAEVTICTHHARFPFRDAKRGLVFPHGRYKTTLAGPELLRARNMGVIESVGKWSCYRRHRMFSEFVDHFTRLRRASAEDCDPIGQAFAKHLLVALFGRFGLLLPKWESIADFRHELPALSEMTQGEVEKWLWLTRDQDGKKILYACGMTGKNTVCRRVGNHWQVMTSREEHPQNFPAIPAFITAFGREHMLQIATAAEEANVAYISTDSILVNRVGFELLQAADWIHPTEPGKLKVEAEGATIELHDVHHYRIGRKRVRGTTHGAAIEVGEDWSMEVQREGLDGLIARGCPASVRQTQVKKTFKRDYRRGVKLPGGRIAPLVLGIDQ